MAMTPEVRKCTVDACFYNEDDDMCHASAIMVGEGRCPMCDTFIANDQHGAPADSGMVGACHEADCQHNRMLSCAAPGIEVSMHMEHADCMTYAPR